MAHMFQRKHPGGSRSSKTRASFIQQLCCLMLIFYITGFSNSCLIYISLHSVPSRHHSKICIKFEDSTSLGNNTSAYIKGLSTSPSILRNTTYENKPILTLFTTFKPSNHKLTIHQNVIRNWALFIPDVIPILYNTSTDPHLTTFALQHGWKVYPSPRLNKNNLPFLKEMYFDAKTFCFKVDL